MPVADALRLLLRLRLLERVNKSNLTDATNTSAEGSSELLSVLNLNRESDSCEEDEAGCQKLQDTRNESERNDEAASGENTRSSPPLEVEAQHARKVESLVLPHSGGGSLLGASDWLRAVFGDPPQLWSLEKESAQLLFGFRYHEAVQTGTSSDVSATEDSLCDATAFRTVSIQKAEEELQKMLGRDLGHKRT